MSTTHRSQSRWRGRIHWIYRIGRLATLCGCAFAIAMLLGAVFPAQAVRADGGVAEFSIRPTASGSSASSAPYFVLNLKPGETLQSSVRITNIGTARGSAALYPVDATTGQTSGVVYRSMGDQRTDVGAWITVGATQFTLDPGKSQIVAFTVKVPDSVRPGQHVGGLVADNLAVQGGSASSVQIKIQHLSIVAVQVNLPGQQIPQMEATNIRAGGMQNYQILYLSLHNSGMQMLKPSGLLQVTDMAGHQLKQMKLTLDTVLPQTAIDYPVYVDGQALGPGHYRAILSLNYGDPQQTLTRKFTFEVTTAAFQLVFGSRAPNTAPFAGATLGGIPMALAIVGGIAALLLIGVASMLFAPPLRRRIFVRKR